MSICVTFALSITCCSAGSRSTIFTRQSLLQKVHCSTDQSNTRFLSLRIALSFRGLRFAVRKQHNDALTNWILASLLDLIDGIAARRLGQCSSFGILLDVIADNVLRSIVWIATISEACREEQISSPDEAMTEVCIYSAIVILEWVTFVSSQATQTSHWKKEMETEPPAVVRSVFKNGFRNPAGFLAVYGLFVAPLGSFVWHSARQGGSTWVNEMLPGWFVVVLIYLSYVGRGLSAVVELWMCCNFLGVVISADEAGRGDNEKKRSQ